MCLLQFLIVECVTIFYQLQDMIQNDEAIKMKKRETIVNQVIFFITMMNINGKY